jgi:hypothetical protein
MFILLATPVASSFEKRASGYSFQHEIPENTTSGTVLRSRMGYEPDEPQIIQEIKVSLSDDD